MEKPILSPFQINDSLPGETEKTPEQSRILAIKYVAQQNILAAVSQYIKDRDRAHLVRIQEIVDVLDDAFCVNIEQADGIPVCVTFNPGGDIPNVGDDAKSSPVLS